MSHRLVALALLAPPAFAACGDATETQETVTPTTWQSEELDGEVGVDLDPVMGTDGDDVVVLAVSDEGVLSSHLSSDGEPFKAGTPLATDLDYLMLGDVVALADGGWFTVGSGDSVEGKHGTELAFRAVGFRSDDGLTWEQVELTGFAGPADVNAV